MDQHSQPWQHQLPLRHPNPPYLWIQIDNPGQFWAEATAAWDRRASGQSPEEVLLNPQQQDLATGIPIRVELRDHVLPGTAWVGPLS